MPRTFVTMHFLVVLAFCFTLTTTAFTQKRILVNGQGDVLSIKKGQSAKAAIDRVMKNRLLLKPQQAACDSSATFGYPDYLYPVNIYHSAYHKDVYGEWYTAPATGIIESVYVRIGNLTGDPTNEGGTLGLRIFNSNIGEYTNTNEPFGIGPGYGAYPVPPETTCWGYFNSTADLDNGVAAFAQDVQGSDTAWHSKYYLNNYGIDTSSFPPTREEIWGHGGWPVNILHTTSPDTVVGVAMADNLTETARVRQGVPFFITLTVPGNHPADLPFCPDSVSIGPPADRTQVFIGAYENWTPTQNASNAVKLSDHAWKFYEHRPPKCYDLRDTAVIHPPCPAYETEAGGWMARGSWNENIWYVLQPDSGSSESFEAMDVLHNTFSTASHMVTCVTSDCNYSHRAAGTASVDLAITINDSAHTHITMVTIDSGTTWEGTVPGAPCGSVVQYSMTATDVSGASAVSPTISYNVLCGINDWYAMDTTTLETTPTAADIAHHGGATIDPSKFFSVAGGNQPDDDGTAGPFAIGNFVWFGDTMHYAWIGVNGGIALSTTATDTIDVNFGGAYPESGFLLPYPQRNKFTADNSTNTNGGPRNLVAPMYADLIVADTLGQYGNIFHALDTVNHKFIVEWAGLAEYGSNGYAVPDVDTFSVVLDGDGVIEFHYMNAGTNGVDAMSACGVEADSALTNPGYFQTCNFGYPQGTKPRNNWGVELDPTRVVCYADGWNLVAVPGLERSYAKAVLYPTAQSNAFEYLNGYVTVSELETGRGYWMKFIGAQCFPIPVICAPCVTDSVNNGWNIIGGLCGPVPVAGLSPSAGLSIGTVFGYSNGYSGISSLLPGQGYWVKVTGGNGTITLCTAGSDATAKASSEASDRERELGRMNSFTLRSGTSSQTLYVGNEKSLTRPLSDFEMPPAPPNGVFDARFASGRMVETYPATIDPAKEYSYAIDLHSATYPVTLRYDIASSDHHAFVVRDGGSGRLMQSTTLNGSGSVRITNSAVKSITLKLVAGAAIPRVYALSQNFPNPFNPTTTMTVDLPKSGTVELAVYDILGRRIATILSGEQTAGSHAVTWDGKDGRGAAAPSGTYFVRMSAHATDGGDFSSVKKIMLLK